MRNPLSVLLVLFACGITSLGAPAQDKQKFVQAQKTNTEALKRYTWTSRTELKLKGESKNVKLEQVRYDIEGKVQKTPIGGTPPPQGSGSSGRGLRGRVKQKVVENKKEEFADLMQSLADLAQAYVHMPPEAMQAFAQNATYSRDQDGSVRIQGANVLQQGDSMTLWVDPSTSMMRRVEIKTSLENKPVHLVAMYQSAAGAPTHVGRATLQYPEKGIEVTVDNYEYQRVSS